MNDFKPTIKYRWSRKAPIDESYEVSSKGDTRFSALVAKLQDGRTIEEAYQLDVKGYRRLGNDWRLGKGKSPLIPVNNLPKLTSHYFDLKNKDKFHIFHELIDLSNCCSKLICTTSRDKSINDFIKIVKSEHSDKVNSLIYDEDDIVLCLIDSLTKDTFPNEYTEMLKALKAAGSVRVLSFVTLVEYQSLGFINPFDQLSSLISPTYTSISGSGYFVNIYEQYRNLWSLWVTENIEIFKDLAIKAHGKVLTDVFAATSISQARALCDILNKYYNL